MEKKCILSYVTLKGHSFQTAIGKRLDKGQLKARSGQIEVGLPKGCMLSNEYFTRFGEWYARAGGLCELRAGRDTA